MPSLVGSEMCIRDRFLYHLLYTILQGPLMHLFPQWLSQFIMTGAQAYYIPPDRRASTLTIKPIQHALCCRKRMDSIIDCNWYVKGFLAQVTTLEPSLLRYDLIASILLWNTQPPVSRVLVLWNNVRGFEFHEYRCFHAIHLFPFSSFQAFFLFVPSWSIEASPRFQFQTTLAIASFCCC